MADGADRCDVVRIVADVILNEKYEACVVHFTAHAAHDAGIFFDGAVPRGLLGVTFRGQAFRTVTKRQTVHAIVALDAFPGAVKLRDLRNGLPRKAPSERIMGMPMMQTGNGRSLKFR